MSASDILPIIQPKLYTSGSELPMYKDVAWDITENRAVWKDGEPVFVEGLPAVVSWAYNSLQTERYHFPIYSRDYGCEINSLVGQGYSSELIQSEAARYLQECLLVSPYIQSVRDVTVTAKDNCITVGCKLETVYGEVEINV